MMRKNSKFYLGILLVSGMLGLSSPARSQLVGGVSFDFGGDAAAAITPVFEQIQTAADEAVKYAKEKVTKLKASIGSYFTKRKNAAEKVPGTKQFAEETSVDIYDPAAVQIAINELFLQYPSSDQRVNRFYEKEAAEFYYDTMIEIQTASKKLEAQLNSLRTEIDNFSKDAIAPSGGNAGSMSSSDENGNYYNLYLAHKKFNDVLKVTEEVMALYSQYYVARAIYRKTILPAPYQEESAEGEGKKSAASRYFSSKMAFAQFVSGSTASAAAEEEEAEDTETKRSSYTEVNFAVPEAPEAKSLMAGSEKELADLGVISDAQKSLNEALKAHNTIRLLPTYRNIFRQYELFKQMHEKAAQAVASSDQCVVQYLGRRYDQPEKVWYGTMAAPADPTDYDSRTGLSGWAVAAYQVANADKTAGLDTDSFATLDLGAEADSGDLASLESVSEKAAAMDSASALANPSKEEEFSAAAREVELVTWQIGAQAAKILAEDQYSDSPVYGKAAHPYPLWQDQKSFYNQYIDGKYENMKTYIRNLDLTSVALKIAQLINDDRPDGTAKSAAQRGLQRLAGYISENGSGGTAASGLVKEKMTAVAKVDSAREAALKPYLASKEKLSAELDKVAAKISELNDQISLADSEAASGNAKAESSYSNIRLMNNRGTTDDSVLYEMARSDFAEGSRQMTENMATATQLRAEVKTYEGQRDELNKKIDSVNEKIASIEEDYLNRKSVVEAEYDAKLESAAAGAKAPTLAALVDKLDIDGFGLSSVISDADSLVSDAKGYAVKLIDKARQDMYNLGDGLYETKNNGVVVKRHKELIDDLKNMPREQFIRSAVSVVGDGASSSVASMLSGALTSAITGQICGKVSCKAADSEYFVGLPAKPRDFAAPKAPEFEHYPSPRDIVHFDATDYKNIRKTNDGIVAKSSILEYGGEIPGIWRQMLADDAFVEKGLNLTSLLEQGGESKYLMRGPLYPCRIGNYTIDIASSKVDLAQTSGQYLVSPVDSPKRPVCGDISVRGTLYYTVTDLELDESVRAGTQKTPAVVSPSELGTLFAYSGRKLKFNDAAYNVYERMLELEDKANGDNFKYEVRDNVYQKSMYANNQIGNFLHFVDKENSIRKNMDELQLSIDDARETIREMLSEMGFKLADDFNLANDEEYAYIRNKLIEYKSNLVGLAASDISTVNNANPVVKERYDKVENTRAALVQDQEALVNLTNSTAAGSSLSEAIISEKANQEVMEKSQQEALDAIRKEIDNYEKPLCTAY